MLQQMGHRQEHEHRHRLSCSKPRERCCVAKIGNFTACAETYVVYTTIRSNDIVEVVDFVDGIGGKIATY